MKQKPIVNLESAAVEKAIAATLAIRPDLNTPAMESVRAVLSLVARETARNLTEALTNEGYLKQGAHDPIAGIDLSKIAIAAMTKGKPAQDLASAGLESAVAQGTDLAIKVISALLADKAKKQ